MLLLARLICRLGRWSNRHAVHWFPHDRQHFHGDKVVDLLGLCIYISIPIARFQGKPETRGFPCHTVSDGLEEWVLERQDRETNSTKRRRHLACEP